MNLGGPCHCMSPRIALPIMRDDRFVQLWRLPGEEDAAGAGTHRHPHTHEPLSTFHQLNSQIHSCVHSVLVKGEFITDSSLLSLELFRKDFVFFKERSKYPYPATPFCYRSVLCTVEVASTQTFSKFSICLKITHNMVRCDQD